MGCVGGFNKNCDKCIINSNKCKKQLNETLEKMNNYAKYEYEHKQVREFNEIYQSLLALESERNKNNLQEDKNIDLLENQTNLNEII